MKRLCSLKKQTNSEDYFEKSHHNFCHFSHFKIFFSVHVIGSFRNNFQDGIRKICRVTGGQLKARTSFLIGSIRERERIFIYLPYADSNLLKCHIQTSNIHMGDLRSKFEYDICVMLRCQSTTAEDNGLDAVVQLPNALEEGLPGK